MNKNEQNKGITLMALVIIIVILLVLLLIAGIAITILFKGNGVLTSQKTTMEVIKEEEKTTNDIPTKEEENKISEWLEVGSIVTYNPNGSYNWQGKYYSSDDYEDVTLESKKGEEFNISTWKVLSIDKTTGNVELVPSNPTPGTVTLQGAQGYNNAVKLLNDACSSLYGNEEKGIKARSINIEDIEKYMTEEAVKQAHKYIEGPATPNHQVSVPLSKYTNYPAIYAEEVKSVINGKERTNGLGLSEQIKFIEKREEKITTATSIQPYQTYWKLPMKGALKKYRGGANDYYNLIMQNGTSTTYWVASRAILVFESFDDPDYGETYFGVNTADTSIRGVMLFESSGSMEDDEYYASLFPIICVNSKSIVLNENPTSGFSIK